MKIKTLTVVVIVAFAGVAAGQTPGSSARDIRTEIQKTDPRVDQIIERANDHFNKGKLNLKDNQREQARDEFDKAIDEILTSGLDVRASQRLQTFYLELVEKIYREEAPLRTVQNSKAVQPKQSPLDPPSNGAFSCSNQLFERASIKGVRLRMTLAQIRALIPDLPSRKSDALGKVEIDLRAPFKFPPLKDLFMLSLKFLDGKLFEIVAAYANGSVWQSSEQFAAKIAEQFHLPGPLFWTTLPGSQLSLMPCRDSYIVAGMVPTVGRRAYPMVMLVDHSVGKDLDKRTESRAKQISDAIEKSKAENRRTFKP